MRGSWLSIVVALVGCDAVFRITHIDPTPPDATIPTGWEAISVGGTHVCAIDVAGSLWCWGGNTSGQTGTGSQLALIARPAQIGTETWLEVDAGANQTCAITTANALFCWGANNVGQLGIGNTIAAATPTQVDGTWAHVSTGAAHTCAIAADTTLWCWGDNPDGRVGDGSLITRLSPVQIGTATWSAVASGYNHTCGLQTGGGLWCWGANTDGQLGDGTTTPEPAPIAIDPADSWSQITAGYASACGRTSDNHLRCWGYNVLGALGTGTTTQSMVPVAVGDDFSDWTDVSMTYQHTCGTRSDGSIWCWGDDAHGQLGIAIGATHIHATPTQVPGGPAGWSIVATGYVDTCAIDTDHSVWCTGADGSSELADGGTSAMVPTVVPGTWSSASVGEGTTCAIDTSGLLSCAGINAFGQLGNTTTVDSDAFEQIGSATWTAIAAGYQHECGIQTGGSLWCWGLDNDGQIGNGMMGVNLATYVPTSVAGTWKSVGGGSGHTCAINSASVMSCWGWNFHGQLGLGVSDRTTRVTPVVVPSPPATWTSLGVGMTGTCGLSATAMYCWGYNGYGEVGNNTTGDTGLVTLDTGSYSDVRSGGYHTCALQSADHSASCWGYNVQGQLGLGDAVMREIPTRVDPSASWLEVVPGFEFTCGIHMDHTLWCWGSNSRGQLGSGRLVDLSLPAQVGSDSDWMQVVSGYDHACALKMDQTLWCWGNNDNGQLAGGNAWTTAFVAIP